MVYSTHIKDQQTQTKIFEEQKKPPLLSSKCGKVFSLSPLPSWQLRCQSLMEYVKVSKFVLGAQASCTWDLSPLISISDDDLIWSLKCQIGTQVQIAKQLSAHKILTRNTYTECALCVFLFSVIEDPSKLQMFMVKRKSYVRMDITRT